MKSFRSFPVPKGRVTRARAEAKFHFLELARALNITHSSRQKKERW